MQLLKSETKIAADRELVWLVLTRQQQYHEWNSQIRILSGAIRRGAKVKINLKPLYHHSIRTSFRVKESKPLQSMQWSDLSIIPGLLRMKLSFTLQTEGDDSTRLFIKEQFTGLLSFLLKKSRWQGLARRCFLKLNADIKRRSEVLQEEASMKLSASLSA